MPHSVHLLRSHVLRFSSLTLASAFMLVWASACTDSTEPQVATTIEIVTAPPATSAAGLPIATAPAFIVRDQFQEVMVGVAVTVTVTTGSGTITGAPTATLEGGVTPVGAWTLGRTPGTNVLTITAGGVATTTLSVAGTAGAPAKLTAQSPEALTGVVGTAVAPLPRALLADQFDNVIAGATVTITLSNGGVAPATVTSDAQGIVTVPSWTLGTVKGANVLTLRAGTATRAFTAQAAAGAPASVAVVSGGGQTVLGGRVVAPVKFSVKDQYANDVENVTVTFSQTGGGVVGAATAVTGADGVVTAPSWKLGKSAIPQQLRATVGALSANADATVRTAFKIDVRFFGTAMTAEQQQLFTAAAARLSAAIVGDVPDVDATGVDLDDFCGIKGQPVLSEIIDDVVIYASIDSIDGRGKILAQAGTCAFRDDTEGTFPALGVMKFDKADLASLTGAGSLQDVITHEMMHVIGFSGPLFRYFGLTANYNTATVAFTGTAGVAGCRAIGGVVTCATSVPLENTGGAGTANSHWRETTFGNELMTGFLGTGATALSVMTIGAFADVGYETNADVADEFRIPGGSIRAGGADESRITLNPGWEQPLPLRSLTPIKAAPKKLRPALVGSK